MGGRLPSEWVGAFPRNHRAESIGITGRIGSEYARLSQMLERGVVTPSFPMLNYTFDYRGPVATAEVPGFTGPIQEERVSLASHAG